MKEYIKFESPTGVICYIPLKDMKKYPNYQYEVLGFSVSYVRRKK